MRIDIRFCGPPGVANGGYVAGLLAERFDGPVRVTLRHAVPLATELTARTEGDTTLLCHDDRLLVDAVASDLELDVPAAPDFDTALRASAGYVGLLHHPFPGCFVCGTGRSAGDGLRIFAGPVPGRGIVASPWIPDDSIADHDGRIRTIAAWSALDCPGAWADLPGGEAVPRVLGRITGRVDRRVEPGERCVVIGWPIRHEGRKHHMGTAIIDGAGRIAGMASATWFDVERAVARDAPRTARERDPSP